MSFISLTISRPELFANNCLKDHIYFVTLTLTSGDLMYLHKQRKNWMQIYRKQYKHIVRCIVEEQCVVCKCFCWSVSFKSWCLHTYKLHACISAIHFSVVGIKLSVNHKQTCYLTEGQGRERCIFCRLQHHSATSSNGCTGFACDHSIRKIPLDTANQIRI